MGKVDLTEEANLRLEPIKALLTAVSDQRRIIDDLVRALERTMWRELIDSESQNLANR